MYVHTLPVHASSAAYGVVGLSTHMMALCEVCLCTDVYVSCTVYLGLL